MIHISIITNLFHSKLYLQDSRIYEISQITSETKNPSFYLFEAIYRCGATISFFEVQFPVKSLVRFVLKRARRSRRRLRHSRLAICASARLCRRRCAAPTGKTRWSRRGGRRRLFSVIYKKLLNIQNYKF